MARLRIFAPLVLLVAFSCSSEDSLHLTSERSSTATGAETTRDALEPQSTETVTSTEANDGAFEANPW